MDDREKVLHGLNSCGNDDGHPDRCGRTECPYRDNGAWCTHELAHDAEVLVSELLKAQEPRVLPFEELQSIGETWNKNTPPYILVEILDAPEWYTGDEMWVPYSFIRDTIDVGSEQYNKNNYMKRWRCWTSKPTPEQMEATPWE